MMDDELLPTDFEIEQAEYDAEDECRLLTDDEMVESWPTAFGSIGNAIWGAIRSQDAKSARIKGAECQERVKRIFKDFEALLYSDDVWIEPRSDKYLVLKSKWLGENEKD